MIDRRTSALLVLAAMVAVGSLFAIARTGNPPTGVAQLADPPSAEPSRSPSGSLRVSTSGWRTDFGRASVDLSEFVGGGPGKDGIPSIDEPVFESLDAARGWLDGRSPVIALEIGDEVRGYPLAILTWHEIVNDTVAGVPVVVTFCPLCHTALVFERRLDGVTYDFGVSGNLRHSDLVMYDRQSESWWQQVTGEAIVGELTGSRLPFLPSQIVSVDDLAVLDPDARVLSRETGHRRDYGRNPYPGYDRADEQPFLFEGVVDGRVAPKERVVTVELGGEAVAYPWSELKRVGAVNDQVGSVPLVVLWRSGVSSALDDEVISEGRDVGATGVFRSTLDRRRLTFDADGTRFVDRETESSWTLTGVATTGPLAGHRLGPVPHGDHFWFAWAAFRPETRVWSLRDPEGRPAPPPAVDVPESLPRVLDGRPIVWQGVKVAALLRSESRSYDLADLRTIVTRAGDRPERFEIAIGTVEAANGQVVTLTVMRTPGVAAPSLARIVRSVIGESSSASPTSKVVVVRDLVALVASPDPLLTDSVVTALRADP